MLVNIYDNFYEIMSSGLTHKTHRILIPWLKTKFSKSYFDLNYGLISIDWDNGPILDIQIKGTTNTALQQKLMLKDGKLEPITD